MTDINFYQLNHSTLENVLAKLLIRTMAKGKRALVVASSDTRIEELAQYLWVYDPDSWMPHGTEKDGRPNEQPIWLGTNDNNVNHAHFLFLTEKAISKNINSFERCFELLDGNDEDVIAAARQRWSVYKDAGHSLKFWKQAETGIWEVKA